MMSKEFINDLPELQKKIYILLDKKGCLTRKMLMRLTNKPRTTLFDNLDKLRELGLITKFSYNNGKKGRPKIYWTIEL